MSNKIQQAIAYLQKVLQEELIVEQKLKQLVADRTAVERVRKNAQCQDPAGATPMWSNAKYAIGFNCGVDANICSISTGLAIERKLHESVYTLLRIQELELTVEIAKARQELDWVRSKSNLVEVFIDLAGTEPERQSKRSHSFNAKLVSLSVDGVEMKPEDFFDELGNAIDLAENSADGRWR
jgi:hypothetical protein